MEKIKAWPFVQAKILLKSLPLNKAALFQSGFGPSGHPHVGTISEAIRTSMVRRAFEEISGRKTRLIVFSDDMDGMRKIPLTFQNHPQMKKDLGLPLSRVQDPYKEFESFADRNNRKLKEYLESFEVDYEFVSSAFCYRNGVFDETLKCVIDKYDEILEIILPTLGPDRRETYSPFLPISPRTGHVLQTRILGINKEDFTLLYKEQDGEEIELPITGKNIKLQWHVDWAARWKTFDVDYEMRGKDLSPSFILSSKICKAIGGKPPCSFQYELFLNKDGEKISKTTGGEFTIDEWERYASKESLQHFIYGKPQSQKRFWAGIIPRIEDTYQHDLVKYESNPTFENPVWHIHKGNPPKPDKGASYSILLNVTSALTTPDPKVINKYVQNYTSDITDNEKIEKVCNYFEDQVRQSLHFRPPTEQERRALLALAWDMAIFYHFKVTSADKIQQHLYKLSKDETYNFSSPKDFFSSVYECILGKSQGPRLGTFIEAYGLKNMSQLIYERLGLRDEQKLPHGGKG